MDAEKLYSGKSLSAATLGDNEPILTISYVDARKFDKGPKLVLDFNESEAVFGSEKQLVVNKTNYKRIAKAYGTDTDNWIGKKIQLFVDQTDWQGDTVDCIRVRTPKVTAPKKIEKSENTADFDDDLPGF